MAAVVPYGEIPAHEAVPVEKCPYGYDDDCALCLTSTAVTCVKMKQELSIWSPGVVNWVTFEHGEQCHFCAPCYRIAFGAE